MIVRRRPHLLRYGCLLLAMFGMAVLSVSAQNPPPVYSPAPAEGDYLARNFQFKSGESLPEVRIHYYTLGTPQRDASGKVRNAVLILHGTGGSGRQFFTGGGKTNFAEALFGTGQLLDSSKYFLIMPDNVGHGKSSKPSDGLRMKFPHYDYDDMVRLQHDMLVEGLHVDHLRLVMGTSMGCMHSWVWGETYPDFVDAMMPLACLPVELAGRNRMWREMAMDSIRGDPAWRNGNYTEEPKEGLTGAEHLLILVGLAPLQAQKSAPTREQADKMVDDRVAAALRTVDANDMLYYLNASRNYNPGPGLEKIRMPVMAVNSADDFINPPELGIMERDIKRVARGHYVLIPISDETRGHGSHTVAKLWMGHLEEVLQESAPGAVADATAIRQCVPDANIGPVYSVGGDVIAPKPVSTPDPVYSDDARRQRLQGNVVMCIIVGPDGRVHAAEITRSLTPSLDQNSIDTVRRWRFQPALRQGQPVAVRLSVETSFQLQ